jgi:hypothetical protein
MGNAISSLLPQSSPEENYTHSGTGKEFFSDLTFGGNGSVALPKAKGGSDQILSQGDFNFISPDVGGVAGDAINEGPVILRRVAALGLAGSRAADIRDESKGMDEAVGKAMQKKVGEKPDTITTSSGSKFILSTPKIGPRGSTERSITPFDPKL